MDGRFARVDALFQLARRLPKNERSAALERDCADDPALRKEVEELLEALDAAPDREPALDVAGLVTGAWPGDSSPDAFCGFRLVRRIASGGMGVVYEAEQVHPRRRVALKVLHLGAASDEGRRRFEREAEILARLQHPGIAQVHVFGSAPTPTGDSPFLAMELVDGRPLNEHARSLDLRERLDLLAKVCDAVAHAHANGVIHRDLKPSNILVTPQGQPKVLDFGVARLADADTAMRTRTGQVIGTLAYMSPEQATGDVDRVDARTDVYALGVLGYEMFCGRLPHEVGSASFPDAIRRIAEEEPPEPSSLDRRLRGDISLILRKALAKEPTRRYEGAAALAEDIRRHLRHEPIVARPPTATYQLRKFVRRHRALVGGVAATIAALLAGLVLALRAAGREERERIRADQSAADARWSASQTLMEAAASDLRAYAAQSARRRLERVPTENRGWEWRYLSAQADHSTRLVPLDPVPRAVILGRGAGTMAVLDAKGPALAAPGSGRVLRREVPALSWQRLCLLGDTAVAVGADGATVGWTRLDTGETVMAGRFGRRIAAAAGSADGSRIAICNHGGVAFSQIRVLDARSGATIKGMRGDAVEMRSLAFSRDGTMLAAAGFRLGIHVFDADTCKEKMVLRGHSGGSSAIAFGPDGRFLLSGADDKTVILWRLEDGTALQRWTGHEGEVTSVAWGDDGALVASGDALGTIRVWDVSAGTCARVLQGHDRGVWAMSFEDRHTLVSAGQDGIRTWDVRGHDPDVLRCHDGPAEGNPYPYVYAVAFSPDGSLLASAGWDATVRVVDVAVGDILATLRPEGGARVFDVAFTPDGRRILGGADVRALWDADTGRALAEKEPPGSSDTSYAISPDGRLFASTYGASSMLFDTETLETVKAWTDHPGSSDECAFSPDGRLLATVGNNGRCALRTVPGGELVRAFQAHPGGARAIAFDNTGARFATGGEDHIVRVWDTRSGSQLIALAGHLGNVYSVAFHPDGTILASGGNDNTIRLWDLARGVERIELRGHGNYVHGLSFSPDGATLASASGDNTVRLWSTLTMRERKWRADAALAARAAVAPKVEALFATLGDARAVADAVRADAVLDDAQRRAALHLILMRSGGKQ